MDWREALSQLAAQLAGGGVETPVREAALIWEWATSQSYSDWVVSGGTVAPDEFEAMRRIAVRRIQHEPWAYITGRREFFGMELTVTPDVLIPRPETEHLVEAVLAARPLSQQRLVDVGTGSGAIALAVARARPAWTVFGVDINPAAVAVAQQNARRLNLAVTFQCSDLLCEVSGRFDVIAANLPYVAQSEEVDPETEYEPDGALYAGDHGLALIARLISASPSWLAPGGQLFLECGATQARAICQLLKDAGFSDLEVQQDLAGLDRVVAAAWRPGEGESNG
jgi:release factor glutamine methyltransferase